MGNNAETQRIKLDFVLASDALAEEQVLLDAGLEYSQSHPDQNVSVSSLLEKDSIVLTVGRDVVEPSPAYVVYEKAEITNKEIKAAVQKLSQGAVTAYMYAGARFENVTEE